MKDLPNQQQTDSREKTLTTRIAIQLGSKRWAGAVFGPTIAAPDVNHCSTHPKGEEYEEESTAGETNEIISHGGDRDVSSDEAKWNGAQWTPASPVPLELRLLLGFWKFFQLGSGLKVSVMCWGLESDGSLWSMMEKEGRHLQLVAVAVGVERWAEELVVAAQFGLLEFARVVAELPDENAVVTDGQLLHLPPQLQDLLPLTPHQVAHHGQGQRTSALPQLSFTWFARSSRAMLGVPHWFGHWTGNRGQWY
ncbi:hypothetical protein EYF80_027687 [Liparis tanakae]|uniref:Uncharacterized protein n=1 Tax=Liparis tanakae TaxID=230148 RepID=A0A4Z2HA03_9TELE|nr:hypothetical protein EYF80_027687 [Liparis tanakae]